ncbi:hypothetical protein ACFY4H_27500 [Streptomyces althioticus]|uniref:hypothetical protein n=1 Tax=Streptomyces althioticus TaxID=83380 RepID=UPI00367CA28E
MNPLKTAAVVAGTVIVAGAAAPAYAHGGNDVSRVGLNTVAETGDEVPLQRQADRLGLTKKSTVGKTVQKSAQGLSGSGALLGGLPVNR